MTHTHTPKDNGRDRETKRKKKGKKNTELLVKTNYIPTHTGKGVLSFKGWESNEIYRVG